MQKITHKLKMLFSCYFTIMEVMSAQSRKITGHDGNVLEYKANANNQAQLRGVE